MFLQIASPRVTPEDPDYPRACEAALAEPARLVLMSLANASGDISIAASAIATELAFPGEEQRARIYIDMLAASARAAGWAGFALEQAVPAAFEKIVVATLRRKDEKNSVPIDPDGPDEHVLH